MAAPNDAVAVSLNATFCKNLHDNMSRSLKTCEHLVSSPGVAAIFDGADASRLCRQSNSVAKLILCENV
jgi:hypothetical protein